MFRNSQVLPTIGALAALLASLAAPAIALAHERRDVGNYQFVVGWLVEPAFGGEKNGIDLRVSRKPEAGQQTDAKPVEGLEKTLKAEVIFGGQKREMSLRALFRDPGHYAADVVPTRDGDYRFRIFGTIDGTQVNETFDSADGKFGAVEPIQTIQFPQTAAAPAAQTSQAVQAAVPAPTSPQAASDGQVLSIAALIVGVLGLVVGALALAASRRAIAAARAGQDSRS